MHESEVLRRLVQSHQPGFSLAQEFYRSSAIFEAELDLFLAAHWVAVGHASEIPQRGDYFVFEGLNASVIVARGADGAIHAMHNVCRHRGAKLCEQERGRASLFTCRYHGWSYRVSGELAAWRHMPEGLSKSDYSLHRCGVAIFHGIILVSLDPARAPDPLQMLRHTESRWARFDLASCKIAATRTYRMAANWKLAIENNLECYHCLGAHPEYTAANAFVRADEKVSERDVEKFSEYQVAWRAGLEGKIPLGRSDLVETQGQMCRAGTWPMAPGQLTGSQDGKPLAPLLGTVTAYDESVTTGCIGFLTYIGAMCDHALLVTYIPQSAQVTHAVIKWLVRGDASEGTDYDVQRLCWLWDETTRQDKSIIELNAAGVASRGYLPGPYSQLEGVTADFIDRYLKLMARDP